MNISDLDIFVISLEGSLARQKSVESQMRQAGLGYELVKFERWSQPNHPNYDRRSRMRRFGYDLLPGELGCFDSHRSIWSDIVKRGRPAMVLEDDFLIDDLSGVISAMKIFVGRHLDIVRLQCCFKKPKHGVFASREGELVVYRGNPSGTTSYLISPESASHLLNKSDRFYVPVDDYLDHEWRHGICILGWSPLPITTLDQDSEIGVRNKRRLSGLSKLKAELWKGIDSVRSRWYLRFVRPALISSIMKKFVGAGE